MIVRRLVERIRRQDWTAVAIEFVIVVLGILVGLQVNNWNVDRSNRALEATYIARLAKDVRSDIAEIDGILHVSGVRMSVMNRLLEEAMGKPLPAGFDSARGRIGIEPTPPLADDDPNGTGVALFILSFLDGNRAGYDTLINTGGLGLLRDPELVHGVQDYYAMVDKVLHFEVGLEQNRDKLVDAQRLLGISPVQQQSLAELAVLFRSNPPLLATTQNYWLYTNRHLKHMGELKRAAEGLAVRLEGGAP